MAIAPNGVGYITSDPATITLFQPATGAVLGTMSTGGENPRGIAFNAAGTIMAVANKGSASLNLINLRTLRVMRVVPVGQSPRDVVISGEFAYTANYDSNTVSRVNIENGEVTATVGVGSEPRRLAISGQRLFVSNEAGNSVSIINLATMAVIRTIALGATPRNIVVSPDGTTLYVSVLGANQVVKINVAAN